MTQCIVHDTLCTMSTAFRHGQFWFFCHTREKDVEPPHVHVRYGDDVWDARICLVDGAWMETPGTGSTVAYELFLEHRAKCVACWNKDQPNRKVD